MVNTEYRAQYQTRYETGESDDAGTADEELLSTDLTDEGMLTTLRLYSSVEQSIRVEAITQNNDGTDDQTETVFKAHGVSELDTGDFENPVFEAPAQSRISVKLDADSTGDIAVNARVDERTG